MFRNFLLTGIIFLLSAGIFWTTMENLDPLGAQKTLAHIAFFISLFCGTSSFFTFCFFFAAEVFKGKRLGKNTFLVAVRRGILLGIFITVLLILQRLRLLGILELILLSAFLAILEWIFLSDKRIIERK